MFIDKTLLKRGLKRVAAKLLSVNWFALVPDRVKLIVVRRAGVCDWHWYARFIMRLPDAAADGPRHFLVHGNAEGKSPVRSSIRLGTASVSGCAPSHLMR